VELESQADEVRDRGYGIAVISYDAQEATKRFSDANDISFPLLSDVGSETIRRYGILNPVPGHVHARHGRPRDLEVFRELLYRAQHGFERRHSPR
jgi:peroxiredoxin